MKITPIKQHGGLKREVVGGRGLYLFLHEFFGFVVRGVAVDDDGFGGHGTGILAGAAADAVAFVNDRHRFGVPAGFFHLQRRGGAVLGAGAASGAVTHDDAAGMGNVREADARDLLGALGYREERAVGANLGANGAVEVAEAFVEIEAGFHEAGEAAVFEKRGFDDVAGAGAHAELAGGALREDTGGGAGAGRDNDRRVVEEGVIASAAAAFARGVSIM